MRNSHGRALILSLFGVVAHWSGSAAGAGSKTGSMGEICTSRDGKQQRLIKEAGSPGVVVRLTVRGKAEDFPLTGRGAFFGKAKEACGVDTFKIKNGSLMLSYGEARFGDRYIYSIEESYRPLAEAESISCAIDWRTHYAPLSLIGVVFSYEVINDGSAACGPMGFYDIVTVVDLDTGKSVKVTELIDEAGLIVALKADRFVREASENQAEAEHAQYLVALDAADTVDELSAALAMRFSSPPDEVLRRFAFLDYDSRKDLVAVRLVVLGDRLPTIQRYVQLGVMVAPKKEKRPLFVGAKNGAGFFLGRYPNTLVQWAGKKR